MFDGLKEKLSGFTEDVEEEAEELPEDEEAEDAEAVEEDATDTDDPSADAEASASAVDGSEADAAGADAAETEDVGAGTATDAADGDGVSERPAPEAEAIEAEPDDEPGPDEEVESPEEPEPSEEVAEDEAADEDDGGRGLAQRAKLFASGKTVIDESDLEAHLDDLEFALLGSDVELGVAETILDRVESNLVGDTRTRLERTGNLVQDALRDAIYEVISVGQFDFEERIAQADQPAVLVFTGVNGVGKTTTIAKLARYLEERGYSAVLANGDTYRAGANEQLEQHAEALDKKFISHELGSDPAAVLYDAVEYAEANDVDVVLGDTAGRLHTDEDLMNQLSKIDRVVDPDMTVFVDEAVAGQDAVNRARQFNEAAEVDGTILTKADADPQGGAALSIAHVTGKPILFLGVGQGYDDLERFDPEEIVDELLEPDD